MVTATWRLLANLVSYSNDFAIRTQILYDTGS